MSTSGYIGVDLDLCRVIFKADCMKSACLVSAMDHLDSTHCIFPIERQMACEKHGTRVRQLPRFLATFEMKKMWENLKGSPWPDSNIGKLMDALQEALIELPCDPRSLFQLEQRAGPHELEADKGDPTEWERPIYIQPLSVPASALPSAPPSAPAFALPSAPRAPWEAPAPAIAASPGIPSPSPLPSAPSAPKAPPSAPSPKGATGKVWAIADELFSQDASQTHDMKAFRKKVVDACEREGINPGTAATQFGKWKAGKGL